MPKLRIRYYNDGSSALKAETKANKTHHRLFRYYTLPYFTFWVRPNSLWSDLPSRPSVIVPFDVSVVSLLWVRVPLIAVCRVFHSIISVFVDVRQGANRLLIGCAQIAIELGLARVVYGRRWGGVDKLILQVVRSNLEALRCLPLTNSCINLSFEKIELDYGSVNGKRKTKQTDLWYASTL